MPVIISNSSPIIHLAKIGRLILLREFYGTLAIPKAVYEECLTEGKDRQEVTVIRNADWLNVDTVSNTHLVRLLLSELDRGESESTMDGLNELKVEEGLIGLIRAFMYAGSPSVLVSLWSVSDPSTSAFMKRFYRNLNKGMTKAKALQDTKRWMIEKSYHTDEHGNVIKHDHPFYWAPFILVGASER